MQLSPEDLSQLAQVAVAAATEAGQLIRTYRDRDVTVQRKVGGESLASQVVTEVDELSQEIILKHLLPTCEAYDLGLLSEEQTDDGSRLQKTAFWCIDPLDGTLAFVESIPGYAVSIALVGRDGRPLIGVAYDPVQGVMYSAVRGQGALREGHPWQLTKTKLSAPLHFISDRSIEMHPKFAASMDRLKRLAGNSDCSGFETILGGGAVMNALWVLEQGPACYFKFPKPKAGGGSLWDYAATACIYGELGAWVSDFSGERLDLNRPDCTFMNHRGLLFASDAGWAGRIRQALKKEDERKL